MKLYGLNVVMLWGKSHYWKIPTDGYKVFQKTRKGRGEDGIALSVKHKIEYRRLGCGGRRISIEFLLRLEGSSRKWNLVIFQSGWWGQQNLNLATRRSFVSVEHAPHWWRTFITFTCWENNTVLHSLPIGFLQVTEQLPAAGAGRVS